jgi:hypothetical protein
VIGWWPLDGNTVAEIGPDLAGPAGYEPGLIGDAARFSGANTLVADPFPAVSTGVSVDMWIRPAATGFPQVLVSRWQLPQEQDNAGAFALLLIGDDLLWTTDEASTLRPEELRVTTTGLYDGDFHHVAATWSTTEMAIYVDGLPVAALSSGSAARPASATRCGTRA